MFSSKALLNKPTYTDLTLKEISHILEVSESRISQLHTKGLMKMKKKLGDYMGILSEL